jgi:HSP20 family protein
MAVNKISSTAKFGSHASTVGNQAGSANGHWLPSTDVYVTDNGLVIKVELAGMKSDNLEINVEGNRLRISGSRPDCCRATKCSFLLMEINYGPFERFIELPAGYDLGQARAAYLNGFLRIDVPVAVSHSKSTKVPIAEGT